MLHLITWNWMTTHLSLKTALLAHMGNLPLSHHPMFRTQRDIHAIECLYKGVFCTCQVWLFSSLSFIPRLSHRKFQLALVDWVKVIKEHGSLQFSRASYLSIVEMPTNGRKYHHTIASLWLSNLVDNLQLNPAMMAHITSADLTNPRQITIHSGKIISLLSQLLLDVTCCYILTW